MKNGTEHDRVTMMEGQDRRAPSTPEAHVLTPAQLELVAGGIAPCLHAPPCPPGLFVKR
jgi:hypothetical protein